MVENIKALGLFIGLLVVQYALMVLVLYPLVSGHFRSL